jgi:hypothetical protein
MGSGQGAPCWWTDDLIAWNRVSAISVMQLTGQWISDVAAYGSSPLFATNQHWLAWPEAKRATTNWGLNILGAAPLGMAPDGTAFLLMDYQSGSGIGVCRPGEFSPSRVIQTQVLMGQFSCWDASTFVWGDGARKLWGLPTVPTALGLAFQPTLIGSSLISYWTPGYGQVLHGIGDTSEGWIVTSGNCFGLVGVDTGTAIELAYTTNQAEIGQPVQVTITTPPQPFIPPLVPPVDPPVVPPIVPPVIIPPKEERVYLTTADPIPFIDVNDVTTVPHPDGQGLVALKTAAGLYKSFTEAGKWDEDKPTAGAYERFFPYGGGIFVIAIGGNRLYTVGVISSRIPYYQP